MYEEFYGFTEKPFKITPNPDYLYMSPKHKNALSILQYGLEENVGFILLTGEIGSGKTTLINYLLKQIESDIEVAVLFNTNVNSDELLKMILLGFELEPSEDDRAKSLEILYNFLIDQYADHKRSLLIIDEAQNLSREALEEVRMLSNLQSDDQMLLQVALVGQPELKMRLKDPGFVQFAQRIAVNYHLQALTRSETIAYIKHRLQKAGGDPNIFSTNAESSIFKLSGGIPRTINLLCDSALVYGFADEAKNIDVRILKSVIKELGFMGMYSPPPENSNKTAAENDSLEIDGLAERLQGIEDGIRNVESHLGLQSRMIKKNLDGVKDELIQEIKNALQQQQNRRKLALARKFKNKNRSGSAKTAPASKPKSKGESVAGENSKKSAEGPKLVRRGVFRDIRDIIDF